MIERNFSSKLPTEDGTYLTHGIDKEGDMQINYYYVKIEDGEIYISTHLKKREMEKRLWHRLSKIMKCHKDRTIYWSDRVELSRTEETGIAGQG